MRAQYIDTTEIMISVGTWNVGGRLPPDDLDIEEWLGTKEPADMYVLGFQEVVPLNAGNIFGAEDNSPVAKWETIIRRTLNKTRPTKTKCKCHSAPPSPSRLNASDASDTLADEILSSERDVVSDEEVGLLPQSIERQNSEKPINYSNKYNFMRVSSNAGWIEPTLQEQSPESEIQATAKLKRVYSNSGRIGLKWPEQSLELEAQALPCSNKLGRVYSSSERIGLSWPEQPLHSETQDSPPSVGSFRNSHFNEELSTCLETFSVSGAPVTSTESKRGRSHYVRIVSKQMVGIFVSVWVRRTLRRHINNLKVSPIGVGVMGYIGNKVILSRTCMYTEEGPA